MNFHRIIFSSIILSVSMLILFTVHAQVRVSSCRSEGCTLTIPRYKMFMSKNNPNVMWMIFEASRGNFLKTTDGGMTWNATTPDSLTARAYLDYHASIDGDINDNIYIADPGIGNVFFRKMNAPGEADASFNSPIMLTSAYIGTYSTRSNVLVEDTNSIFVFSRTSSNTLGNVRYFHSTDGGLSFPSEGWVSQTNSDNVRIGSLLVEGKPVVVIKYVNYPPGKNIDYAYFMWDGNKFIANADSAIVTGQNLAQQREYAMSYVDGDFHLVWNQNNYIMHAWKQYNNGQGTWNKAGIDTLSYTPRDWHPSLTSHGNDLYIFYVRQETTTAGVNNIYYRKWNKLTSSWSNRIALTTDSVDNRFPNGPRIVNPQADYIPVTWSRTDISANSEVWLDTIPVNSVATNTSANNTYNNNFKIYPNPSSGMFNVQWVMANGNTSTASTINHSRRDSFEQPLTVEVYNVFGEQVADLTDKTQINQGANQLVINASGLNSGVYYCVLNTGNERFTRKLILINEVR